MNNLLKKYTTILESGKIEESEIISLKSVLQGYKKTSLTIEDKESIEDLLYNGDDIMISEEQTKKGYNFLMNKWKTPKGKERASNPFSYREQETLNTFEHFTFDGYYDNSNVHQSQIGIKNLEPLYSVIGKDNSFQYYYTMIDSKINIVG